MALVLYTFFNILFISGVDKIVGKSTCQAKDNRILSLV
jgi:hypothetical protein